MMGKLAIIAGRGGLAAALVAVLAERPMVAALEGFMPEGLVPDQVFRIERLMVFLAMLRTAGIERVIFAGAVQRPRLDPALFDPMTAQMVPRMLTAIQAGDDATLRVVIELFEESGLRVIGVADVAPDLVPGEGVLCGEPSAADTRDAARAAAIVAALGAVDVGQAAVVAQGLCLAVEALPGTDAMLDFVTQTAARPDPARPRGVLWKAPKPGQDWRVDLPTLGVETVRRAAVAGLAGIAWAAGGVILLDRAAMVAAAQDAGLFLWARQP